MKTPTTLVAIAFAFFGVTGLAAAHDVDDYGGRLADESRAQLDAAPYTRAADYGGARHFYRERYMRLRYEMDHLDRMLGHVRGELRAYRAGRQLWSQYGQARAEFAHLNSEFRRGTGSWRHIHGEIERLHARLHDLETRLRVRASDRYRW